MTEPLCFHRITNPWNVTSPSADDVLQYKAGAWTNRTPSQLATDLNIETDLNRYVVYNVKEYGATGNGSTDDTQAIQDCIDAAIGGDVASAVSTVRTPNGPVYIPPGTYRVSAPLKAYSTNGFFMFGEGDRSKISAGAPLTKILDLNGMFRGYIGKLVLSSTDQANNTVDDPIHLYWDNTASLRSTSGTIIDHIRIGGVKFINGIRLGRGTSVQVDNVTVTNCAVSGAGSAAETTWYQTAYFSDSGSGNALNHWFYNCTCNFVAKGFWAKTVNQYIKNCDIGHNGVDFYHSGSIPFSVDGWRSEASGQTYVQQGGASFPSSATLKNGIVHHADSPSAGQWPFDSSGRFIEVQYSGAVTLENVVVSSNNTAIHPKIRVNQAGAGKKTHVTLIGCQMSGAVTDLFEFSQGEASVTLINHSVQSDANQTVEDTIPYYHRNAGSTGRAPMFYAGIDDLERLGVSKVGGGELIRPRIYAQVGSISASMQQLNLTYFRSTRTETITSLSMFTAGTAAGATPTLVRMGVYEVADNGDLTLLRSTTNDTSLLASTHTKYTKALSSTWAKVSGQVYAIGLLVVTTAAAPTLVVASGQTGAPPSATFGAINGVEPKLMGLRSSQSDLPASITAANVANYVNGPFVEMNV